jgi:UDP-N-acetyl-D-galactosamine dehydrogenase
VAHKELRARSLDQVCEKVAPNGLYVDVKSQADAASLRARGITVWRL